MDQLAPFHFQHSSIDYESLTLEFVVHDVSIHWLAPPKAIRFDQPVGASLHQVPAFALRARGRNVTGTDLDLHAEVRRGAANARDKSGA